MQQGIPIDTSARSNPLNRRVREGAQGMLEFALVLPLLLLLIFGIIEFGRLLFIYSAVFTASREAARYGSAVGDNGSGTLRYKDCEGIRAAAMGMGSLAGIEPANVIIEYDDGPGSSPFATCNPGVNITGEGKRVKVTVNAGFSPMVPLVNLQPAMITSVSHRTIFKDIEIGGTIPNTPTPGAAPTPTDAVTTVHVGGMSGSSSWSGGSGRWKAYITITVHDNDENTVSGASVSGSFSAGNPSAASCTTNASGQCNLNSGNIDGEIASVTFSVNGISGNYNAADNHPGSISVNKPD